MKSPSTPQSIVWVASTRGIAVLSILLALMTACSEAEPSPSGSLESSSPPTTSAAATSSAPAVGGGTQPLDPGGLEAGTRYVIEALGVSVQPDVDGWFAVMYEGGDAGLSRGDVTIRFLRPDTVLSPDGTQIAAPTDPQALLNAIDATQIAAVLATEPFEMNGVSGLSAELEAAGGSEAAPLLTTPSGEFGLTDGQVQWIVIELDGTLLIVSLERPDAPDIDAAWVIAGPLVESLDVAP